GTARSAERTANTIAREKCQPRVVNDQSPAADCVMPTPLVSGPLNTENAYASPIHRCTARAAGGTIQREKPGRATVACLEKKEGEPDLSPGFAILLMWSVSDGVRLVRYRSSAL